MEQLLAELAEKEQKLDEMKQKCSKSFCVDVHTSESYMKFQMEMEELEDDIAGLKKRLKQKSA